jgi:hypothetical protein
MFIDKYYQCNNQKISFTRQQASKFAKEIADDFNPLHNIDAKRFCVPGDLLFSVILSRCGLHPKMTFNFTGMVNNEHQLNFPNTLTGLDYVTDDNEKQYLTIAVEGEVTKNEALASALIKAYVEFSGHTFPHILVELMKQHQVMINPARPMIMYESMSIDLFDLTANTVSLAIDNNTLSIEGKRGNACLTFNLLSEGKVIGQGKKHMLLSALRPYCQETIDEIVAGYNLSKQNYITAA